MYDPVIGKSGGRLDTCERTNTCPQIFEVNSENEFWAKGGSMLVTDGQGHDLDLARTPQVRYYLLSSLEHSAGSVSLSLDATTTPGICQQPSSPMVGNVVLRALLVDLDQWATHGTSPPPNAVPRIADRTFAPALPQATLGFPSIPGVEYDGIHRVTCGISAHGLTRASYRCCRPNYWGRRIKSTFPRRTWTVTILRVCAYRMSRYRLQLIRAGDCAPRTPDSRSRWSTDAMRPASEFPSPRPQRLDSRVAPLPAIRDCPLPSAIQAALTT
jgi:hypothetical protein